MTLVYHTRLEESWREAALKLQADLSALRSGPAVALVGRSKNQKIVLDRDYLIEQMPVSGKTFSYKQVCKSVAAIFISQYLMPLRLLVEAAHSEHTYPLCISDITQFACANYQYNQQV